LPDDVEGFKKTIRDKIDSYVFSLKIYVSFKEFLERNAPTRVYIEKDLQKTAGGEKRPDLYVRTATGHVVIDHKYITSSDAVTLKAHLRDVSEYQCDYSIDGQNVRPEVSLLCQLNVAQEFRAQALNPTVSILGYTLERNITIEQVVGQIQDPSLKAHFAPTITFPVSDSAIKYKFIREEPPVPYTAQTIYASLWPLRDEFESPEFKVSYHVVLEQFNTLFPRWLAPDIQQMTSGRLNSALRFLSKIGWIRWEQGKDEIFVIVAKGSRIPDLLEYLLEAYAEEQLIMQRRQPRPAAPKKIKPAIAPQVTLDKWSASGSS